MKNTFSLGLLAIACAPSLQAEPTSKLEELVITSSRVEMPLRQIGTSVSVITIDDIEAYGFNSLYDILRTSPGVAVTSNGGVGSATTLRIRGEEGYRTRVYVDGINISDASGLQFSPNIEHLLSGGVERVEILRGPQGLMHGADAGGIVDVRSRTFDEGFGGDVSAEGGRFGTTQYGANVGGGNSSADINLSAYQFETDGFNTKTTDIDLRDDDGYENTSFHGKLGWNATEDLRIELVGRDVSSENDYDSCLAAVTFAPSDDCTNDYDQQAWRASVDYQGTRFDHQVSYSGNDTDRQFYTEGVPTFGGEGELETWSYLGNFDGGDSLKFVYGADLQKESFDDGSVDRERDQDGYFLEYQGGFGDSLYLTAGARYDDNEDFGNYTTYRISAAYIVAMAGGELKFKSTYGTGLRAPSLSEIAYNAGPFSSPPASDVNLQQEESDGYDIGVAWYSSNGLYLEANYFDQTISDEIFFDLDAFSGYLQASGDNNSRGVELIAEWPLSEALSLTGNYTYNDTDTADGAQRLRRPEHIANLGVSWRPMNERLTLSLFARGSWDSIDIGGSSLDDYEVVDISASYAVLPKLEVYARMENLFDEDYQEVPDYNTAGAAAYAGLRYSF
ncbi:MAG: vitamin B12 transporter [Halieaceae bacterium]|jgi:vitamin B12 transporter